ncbi:C40 family peptidase [Proteiniclasticum ruminis]|uniref:Cell wall-associated hydrolase, NlpC family n=1 Tax=Proteiniclasticum ruminis TaxID=398199 RepID=A0A1I4Y8B8_9CLOT|nr:C40 family peptidase [Proteiniclasticum ruminis]SFN34338.1 Cell wall-associated hydrolase, NlpC family [Proteiniclasticum ruminis]
MKNIKLKVIAAVIASSTIFGVTIPVNATPVSSDLEQNVQIQQEEYKEIENKINTLHMEISVILDEITDIMVKIEDNDAKITEVEAKKAETEARIRETESDLHMKIEEYGERLRAMYKQGNSGMISAILGAESLADFIARAEAIIQFAKIDRQLLDEIEEMKAALENEKSALQQNIDDLQVLKAANEKDMAEAELKKSEADEKLAQLEEEERKVAGDLSNLETMLISTSKSIVDDSSSSDDQLNAAITELRNIRSRIITDKADEEVVRYIEKAKAILKERKLARERAQASSNAGYTGSASVSSSAIVNKAYQYLGVRYVWGGTTPSGFDCSGFIQYVYRSQGVSLPRTSRAQATSGKYVSIANAQPGDILYFGQSSVTHVGIYIGNGKMIHSPRPGKSVEIVSISWHVNNYRIKGARRI